MRQIIDSTGKVIYQGNDAKEVLRILTADKYSISEEDEVKYQEILYNPKITWQGQLQVIRPMKVKFRGIDSWNRPVYVSVDEPVPTYYGCVNILCESKGEADLKITARDLEYFGTHFNCEPHGGIGIIKLEIVE